MTVRVVYIRVMTTKFSEAADQPLELLHKRLKESGATCEWLTSEDGDRKLRFAILRGRDEQVWKRATVTTVDRYLEMNVQSKRFLGNYDALYDTQTGAIEASLENGRLRGMAISKMPGAEVQGPGGAWRPVALDDPSALSDAESETESSPDSDSATVDRENASPPSYRIRVRDPRGRWSLEVSPATEVLQRLSSRSIFIRARVGQNASDSLKIEGLQPATHDEALKALDELGASFLFDLQLKYAYGANLALFRVRAPYVETSQTPALIPLSPPRYSYSPEALSLYRYATSATGMNLLAFLAYYQVLEFFFARYSESEAISKARTKLRNPLFNIEDDGQLGRLLMLGGGTKGRSEREQLKATLRSCLEVDEINAFVEATPERAAHFKNRKKIVDVSIINIENRGVDFIDQIANRIYDIRCRVVHAKDGGGHDAKLLMPYSPEVKELSHDVDLVRFCAQRALISSAGSMQH